MKQARPGHIEKNRFAQEKSVLENYEDIAVFMPPGDHVYVVPMTLGYRSDEVVIRRLLDKNFKYFGVPGNAAKMKTLPDTFKKKDFRHRN